MLTSEEKDSAIPQTLFGHSVRPVKPKIQAV